VEYVGLHVVEKFLTPSLQLMVRSVAPTGRVTNAKLRKDRRELCPYESARAFGRDERGLSALELASRLQPESVPRARSAGYPDAAVAPAVPVSSSTRYDQQQMQ
jgi:hypothetical protein